MKLFSIVAAGGLCVLLSASSTSAQSAPAGEPLLKETDLTYSGAFRLPAGPSVDSSFAYGGTALTYNAANDSLFIVGHDWFQKVAEVSIPAVRNGAKLTDLATAAFRQPFTDVLEGRINSIGTGTAKIGGMLVSGNSMLVSAYLYYDGSGAQKVSHFRSGVDLARTGDLQGPYQVGTSAGYVSGYMAPIPAEWQAALGGPALTGNCCLPIISRTSLGPSASVFNPADVGIQSPAPITTVLGYPITHPTLGSCETAHTLFNCSSGANGMVFPDGTRSVLFFGRLALGAYCYGSGGASGGDCVDPTSTSKGPHMYPYVYHVWAYDALDLVAVKNGQKQIWEVQPYKTWTFDLPFASGGRVINGATYDPKTKRIFISQDSGDGDTPLIHVFTLAGGVASPSSRPDAPSAVSASVSGSVVSLTWSAPRLTAATQYVVEAGTAPGAADVATFNTRGAATSFSMTGVREGTYYVRVRALSAAGTSDPSADAVVVVGGSCSGAPARPSLSAQVTGRTVTLSWSAAAGATSYNLEAGSAPGSSDLVNSHTDNAGTTYVASSVSPGSYFVRVRAENACGPSQPSNEARVVVN